MYSSVGHAKVSFGTRRLSRHDSMQPAYGDEAHDDRGPTPKAGTFADVVDCPLLSPWTQASRLHIEAAPAFKACVARGKLRIDPVVAGEGQMCAFAASRAL
jgi:hypothetical protein